MQLRRSKTDQEGVGRKVGLPFGSNPLTCPVRALRDWLEGGGIVRGPIFRPIDRHANIKPQRLTDQSARGCPWSARHPLQGIRPEVIAYAQRIRNLEPQIFLRR